MALFSIKLIKIAGIAIVLLGVVAMGIVAVPVVAGQVLKDRQFGTSIHRDWPLGSEIGASLRNVDEADAKRQKLPGTAGAVVEDVRSNGPAAKAGFRAGDVVVTFDGETVRSARHLARLVEETADGHEVSATVIRGGEKVNLKVTPEATDVSAVINRALEPLRNMRMDLRLPERLSNIPPMTREYRGTLGGGLLARSRGRLGASIEDLTEQLGDYFGTRDGVLVTGVDADTPGKTAGLKAGDIITKVDGEPVRDTADLRRRLARTTSETTLTVLRDHKELTLKIKF
jgi:serine protease Do